MPHNESSSLIILQALLKADSDFVSGNDLAEKLGVSRVSIWGRMEQLRSQGFEFEAVTRKGYRITKKPESLNPLLAQAYLTNPEECPDLVFLTTIDSTNDHATRLLANDYEAPFFVISNQQTLGRGRMGRKWHSPPSSNLYLSFGSRPYVRPDRMQLFTLWMGVYVARHLRDWLDLDIGLKWPNDLFYNGKKLGGMLTEARVDADSLRELIFGNLVRMWDGRRGRSERRKSGFKPPARAKRDHSLSQSHLHERSESLFESIYTVGKE